MTTEEKMQYFLEETMLSARKQAFNMVEEYYAAAEQIYLDYKETKKHEAETRINAEKDSLKRAINKEVSAEQILIRKELSDKQEELEQKLFEEVEQMLSDFMKTDAYEKLLISQILAAKEFAGDDEMIIYIDPKDEVRKSGLEAAADCKLTVSEYSFVGGTRAITNSGKILIDNSFETMLREERDKFVFQGGR